MKIGEQYIQYSKIFTSVAGILYAMQVLATIVMVCLSPESSDALVSVLEVTTGVMGIIFGCYSGNSAVEKVVAKSVSPRTNSG